MDTRITLNEGETFEEIVDRCVKDKVTAEMIYDQEGLQRASGIIRSVEKTEGGEEMVVLDSGQKIRLQSIVAINGVFSTCYTCC